MIDISQATLDVIKAIKQKKQIQFVYGSNNCIRELEPTGFFGDFDGFEGKDILLDAHRKFHFRKVTEWFGIPQEYELNISVECHSYPTEEDILEDIRPLVYTINPIEE